MNIPLLFHGEWKTRRVWKDDEELSPKRSQEVHNHSPDGFSWAYGGSGPAQLALAILLELFSKRFSEKHYQEFKWDVIARLPQGDFQLSIGEIMKWAKPRLQAENFVFLEKLQRREKTAEAGPGFIP